MDITACDKEPIHIPGKIQPHGVLLAVDSSTLQVRYTSENTASILGATPAQIFSAGLSTFLSSDHLSSFSKTLKDSKKRILNPMKLETSGGQDLEAIVYRGEKIILIEFEKLTENTGLPDEHGFSSVYGQIDAAIRAIEESNDLVILFSESARQIRALSGFDRVMIYRFDAEWNGRVIAEAKKDTMGSFLDLHFPASDIPKQARELYLINWLRIIPDVSYEPAGLLSQADETAPLDLTHSVLRSVSPIHIQYLKNMGIGASMSISIIRDGKLWGLIACHHEEALFVPYETRQGCEFIGKFLSLQIAAKEKLEGVENRAKKRELISELETAMRSELAGNFFRALLSGEQTPLFALIAAEGVATLFRGEIHSSGKCPSSEQILALARWLRAQHSRAPVFATSSLAGLFPEALPYKDQVSGVVALSVPEPQPTYVFWFRPEVIQTVKWSGSPEKPVEMTAQGPMLSPRRSFDEWKETVKLRSTPWSEVDVETAEELRQRIIAIDLSRQIGLELKAREQAEQSNRELDEFAKKVSHDLREPLRGIRYFAGFLQQDEAAKISAESLENLNQIDSLSQRMNSLIESLYQYSKLGQVDLSFGWVDLNLVVTEVVDSFKHAIQEKKFDIVIQKNLPKVYCDRVRIAEVFSNLVGNSIKYNLASAPRIEIGFNSTKNPTEFFVADNGIGIDEIHFKKIFDIFERLHTVDSFGGGTGIGLTIVERIVKKHGGSVHVSSVAGQGSRFSFTLAQDS